MSLFNELKRRSVFKVGVAYAISAWIVLQLTAILLPIFAAPDWIMRVVVLLLAIGFVVAAFVAWAFEVTPEGIKPTSGVNGTESNTQQTVYKLKNFTIIVLVLALILVAVDSYLLTDSVSVPEQVALAEQGLIEDIELNSTESLTNINVDKSIAVLPFTNLSSDPEQDYFSDGLSDELINKLSQLQDLQVTSRNSSFYFKDSDDEPREIAEQLGVAHILQGSVRKSGDQVRITAQLMDAQNGFNLWSKNFDRDMTDIFAIQDEIAEEVSTTLSLSLGLGEFDRPGMTKNVEAYEAYLKGIAAATAQEFEPSQGIEFMKKAVSLDPEYGLAWLTLAELYDGAFIDLPPEQTQDFLQLIDEAIEQAKQVAPEMPWLRVIAAEQMQIDKSFVEAEQAFLALIEQYGSSQAEINTAYGSFLLTVGRSTEAVPFLQRASRLDPFTGSISINLSVVLLSIGRIEEALAETERGLALGVGGSSFFLSGVQHMAAQTQGDYQEANRIIQALMIDETIMQVSLLQSEGKTEEAISLLRSAVEQENVSAIFNTAIAPHAALAGEPELALQFMINASQGDNVQIFGSLPTWQGFFKEMRGLEGFRQLARDAGLVDYWRATGNWGDFCRPLGDEFECF